MIPGGSHGPVESVGQGKGAEVFVNTCEERGQNIIQVLQYLPDMALTPGECPQNTFPGGGVTNPFPEDNFIGNDVQEPVSQLPDKLVI